MNDKLKELAQGVDRELFDVVEDKIGIMTHFDIRTKCAEAVPAYNELKAALEEASVSHIRGYYGKASYGYDRYYNGYTGDTFVHLYSYDYNSKEEVEA